LTWWELAMILPRDLAVAGIAAYLVWCRAWPEFSRMAARSPGKVTTVFVYSLMLLLLIAPGHAWLLLWPTAVLSVLAAVDYVLILLSFEIKRR
jgi:phosphatidylglycerophosphate synthase